MADLAGLCSTGKTLLGDLISTSKNNANTARVRETLCDYFVDDDDNLYSKLRCSGGSVLHKKGSTNSNTKLEDLTLDINMPESPTDDDDCRKKRCVDRYDSSESSDSGVAILSCTDCSGSSTASSDITDPGSPFSTASSHSEDSGSGSQPSSKMAPTENVLHQPWPWSTDELAKSNNNNNNNKSSSNANIKSSTFNKNKQSPPQRQSLKRKETTTAQQQQSTKCLKNNNLTTSNRNAQQLANNNNASEPSPNKMTKKLLSSTSSPLLANAIVVSQATSQMTINNTSSTTAMLNNSTSHQLLADQPKLQQGKITEYFKSQYKPTSLIKKELSNILKASSGNPNSKYASLVDAKKVVTNRAQKVPVERQQKAPISSRSVPRKILPAPTKPEKLINVGQINNFPPIITTTLIPNLYITKTPKTADNNNIFVPQFTINDNKINMNSIPIVARQPPCIIQPLQKLTAINNFHVKLNATSMPLPATIVKLNNYHSNVISAVPTTVVPKLEVVAASTTTQSSSNHVSCSPVHINGASNLSIMSTIQQCQMHQKQQPLEQTMPKHCLGELSPADSGVSITSNSEVSADTELLSVNVITDEDDNKKEEELKSPILSQPKTIRFPAKERVLAPSKEKIHVSADTAMCQWDQCAAHFEANGALLEHLQVKHVISQETQEQYVCLWQGCKVHGRKSCSRSWLERHVLAHAGTKPFRCIVDGCGQRFNSQLALQRHVNGHFNTDNSPNGSTKKSVDNASVKLYKRNGKKIRFRRQPWSARMFDFIDSGMMEGLQYKLLKMSERVTTDDDDSVDLDGQTLTLHSRIMAKRVEEDGTCKVLLKWHPTDIVDDEWIEERDYTKTRVVHVHKSVDSLGSVSLSTTKNSLGCFSSNSSSSSSCSSVESNNFRKKHTRKPSKQQTGDT